MKTIRPIQVDGDTAYVLLTRDQVAIVDARFAKAVGAFNWSVDPAGYAQRKGFRAWGTGEPHTIRLHRFVMGSPRGLDIDHVSGDKLDCRVQNLRATTAHGNLANMKRRACRQFKGVDFVRGRYRARITVHRKGVWVGSYDTAQEAARAYDAAARKHFGEFARTNAMIHGWA